MISFLHSVTLDTLGGNSLKMEYFNFEDASHAIPRLDLDDLSSIQGDTHQDDANDCFDSLFFDKGHELPVDPPAPAPVKLKLMNNIEIEVIPQLDDPNLNYPMFRAKDACELCARMGLDCFLASRGNMITGCTCCISLYKDCSFTHPRIPKGFVSTFPGITEDQVWNDFGREHIKSLKSFDEARGRKTGARFPRDAVKILKQWLSEHSDHPYPNEREKDDLKQLTGLKRSQISNWLANARRRGKVRPRSGPASPIVGAIDIPQSPTNSMADLNPMDRWKISPPENEPASMTAIARAVTATPLPMDRHSSESSRHGSRGSSRKGGSSGDSSGGFSMFRAPSVSSFETRDSTNSVDTFNSSRSAQSKRSYSSATDRRRRRRAPMTQRTAAQQAKSRAARIFQCTFCTDTFPAKYDWQRHEKSLHLALERWTCCPEGGMMTVPLTGCQHCVFCQQMNPTPEHLDSHNFMVCQEKTLQERTFYRKDHLRQHLKLMHGCKFGPHMEGWKSTTNELKSACGFCPSKFTSWSQRADHLAAHFRNGADMSMWANGWGFEPHIEKHVENAIPPYLIGHERQTMVPYVARFVNGRKKSNTPSTGSGSGLTFGTSAEDDGDGDGELDQMTKDSNCWGRLEQELTKYVTQHKLAGTLPTDKQIQDSARMIVYEDDDPWNWTCADNQQWLDTFKYQQGIGGLTENMGTLGPSESAMPGDNGPRAWTKELSEVPVMAPYVIPGGNKQAGAKAKQAVGKQAVGKQAVGKQAVSAVPVIGSQTAPVAFNPDMELDFEGIDFSNLDLGMMDDGLVLGTSAPAMGNIPATTAGMDMAMSGGYAPVTSHAQDIFGNGFAVDSDMGMGIPNHQTASDMYMSQEELNQLASYSSSFGKSA